MKNISIKNSSVILIGVLVSCLILFLSFRNYKTTHYTINFTATEITSIKNAQATQQPSSSQLLPVKENLETKSALTTNQVSPLSLDAYVTGFSSEIMMAADLQERFDRDEVDPVAATADEKDLAYIFYQGMEWQEFIPQDINCKKRICMLVLTVDSAEKKSRLANLIYEQLKAGTMKFSYVFPVSLPVEKKELIYFVREDLLTTSPGVLP